MRILLDDLTIPKLKYNYIIKYHGDMSSVFVLQCHGDKFMTDVYFT